MNDMQIFNKDIIPVYTTDEGNKVVLGRELHEKLGIKEKYAAWFQRMVECGFIEGSDFSGFSEKSEKPLGGRPSVNHIMTLDMAKHIAMIQRTPQGMAIRQKLIELEKETSQQLMPASKELQAIFVLDNRSMQHEKRITALENSMTADYNQQRILRRTVSNSVRAALGGTDAPAYTDRHVRDKVYSECNRDVQDWFRVNSVGNIPRKRFDEAVEYIQRWKPSTNTVMLIQQTNGQTSLFDRACAPAGRLVDAREAAIRG